MSCINYLKEDNVACLIFSQMKMYTDIMAKINMKLIYKKSVFASQLIFKNLLIFSVALLHV